MPFKKLFARREIEKFIFVEYFSRVERKLNIIFDSITQVTNILCKVTSKRQ